MATRCFEPPPPQLRKLVLDYLLQSAYMDTARAFASELNPVVDANVARGGLMNDPGLEAANDQPMEGIVSSNDGEGSEISEAAMDQVRQRKEIQLHILSGRVEEAIQLLNTYFPAVLQENELDAPFPITKRPSSFAPSPFSRLQYTSQHSVKPIHIALNLRIQAFIEASRTVPLIYPGDPKRPSSSSTAPAGANRSAEENAAHQTALLHRAQRLYATVESLRDTREREIYRKQLTTVGGLLAYSEPEKSPIAKYLSQEEREAVANQVNSAILYHMGKPATSHIELYVRQTATVMSVMADNNIPPTPQMRSFLPVEPAIQQQQPPLPQTKPTSGKAEKPDKTEQEKTLACPSFSLPQFLDSP